MLWRLTRVTLVAAIPGGRLRLALHGFGLSPNSNFLVLAITGEHRTL